MGRQKQWVLASGTDACGEPYEWILTSLGGGRYRLVLNAFRFEEQTGSWRELSDRVRKISRDNPRFDLQAFLREEGLAPCKSDKSEAIRMEKPRQPRSGQESFLAGLKSEIDAHERQQLNGDRATMAVVACRRRVNVEYRNLFGKLPPLWVASLRWQHLYIAYAIRCRLPLPDAKPA